MRLTRRTASLPMRPVYRVYAARLRREVLDPARSG